MFYEKNIKDFVANKNQMEVVAGKEYGEKFKFLKRNSVNDIPYEAVYKVTVEGYDKASQKEKFQHYGYIKDGIIYCDEYISDEERIDSIQRLSSFVNSLKKRTKEEISKIIKTESSTWPTNFELSEPDKKNVENIFNEGCSSIENEEIIQHEIICRINDIIESVFVYSYSVLAYDETRLESIRKDAVERLKCFYAKRVAENNYLKGLEAAGRNKKQQLLKLFKELYLEGRRTVNAVFDFGYEQVEVKLHLSSRVLDCNYNFFGGSQKASDKFQKTYYQPVTMKTSYRGGENSDFLDYIKELRIGKKVIYSDDVKCEYVNENRLLNLINRSEDNNLNAEILELLEKETFDISILNRENIVYLALSRFYISIEVFEALDKLGCEMINDSIKKNYIDDNYCRRRTRDFNEYLEKYCS